MADFEMNDLEIAPPAVISQAVRDFAEALTGTPEFQAFEQAAAAVNGDAAAEQARTAFQAKQESLQALLRLNAVSAADAAELERLRDVFLSLPTVQAYAQAEAALTAMCQEVGDQLSRQIGIDFAGVCASGCC